MLMLLHTVEVINHIQRWLFLRGAYDELLAAKTPEEGRRWREAVERFKIRCGIGDDNWRARLKEHLADGKKEKAA